MKNHIIPTALGVVFLILSLVSCSEQEETVDVLRAKANRGDVEAQYKLGQLYFEDKEDGPINLEEAYRMITLASNEGHADALALMGQFYEEGLGVSGDLQTAADWYKKAAEKGSAIGQQHLGHFYQAGRGVPLDYQKALEWFTKAHEQGNTEATGDLATMYLMGLGVDRDCEKALALSREAAEGGSQFGMYLLGVLYYHGDCVAQDYLEAYSWFKASAELGNIDAPYYIGMIYKLGHGITKDEAKAEDWMRKAAGLNNGIAQNELGLWSYERGMEAEAKGEEGKAHYQEAAGWLFKAAYHDYTDALELLAKIYQSKDLRLHAYLNEQFEKYLSLAEAGDTNAKVLIAIMTATNDFGKLDQDTSEKYFREAAAKGHPLAQSLFE